MCVRERERERKKEIGDLRDRELNRNRGIPIHVHTYIPGNVFDKAQPSQLPHIPAKDEKEERKRVR